MDNTVSGFVPVGELPVEPQAAIPRHIVSIMGTKNKTLNKPERAVCMKIIPLSGYRP
jgi:hypothetical protein